MNRTVSWSSQIIGYAENIDEVHGNDQSIWNFCVEEADKMEDNRWSSV
jgi:hypothetical protein